MKHTIGTLLVIGILCMGAGMLQAQPARQPARHEPERMKMMEKLNLTDAQKKQIDQMRTDMQRQAVDLRSKIQLARIDLRELLKADEPDRAAIEKKVGEIGSLQTKQKLLRIDHMFDVKKILTPDQQKIWKEEMKDFRMEHRHMMGERQGMPGNHRGMMFHPQGMREMPQGNQGNDW